jgi:hypothetical protein
VKHTCQWRIVENGREVSCGLPAPWYILWSEDDAPYWYCTEHYDLRIAFLRDIGRQDVLKLSDVE